MRGMEWNVLNGQLKAPKIRSQTGRTITILKAMAPGSVALLHPPTSEGKAKDNTCFVLILFAGWLWLRLDFMNQLELIASEYINDGVKQARAEARRRLEDDAKFKQLILGNLSHCQEAAEKNKESYVKLMQDAVRSKNANGAHGNSEEIRHIQVRNGQGCKMLETAKAECQQIYDTHLLTGK